MRFKEDILHESFISFVKKYILYAAVASLSVTTVGCSSIKEESQSEKSDEQTALQIGMSFDTFVLERWIRDRDVFVSTASDLGAEVNVQNANGDADEQASQIEYLIDKGMDVLVIVAVDGTSNALESAIKRAHSNASKSWHMTVLSRMPMWIFTHPLIMKKSAP